MAEENLSESERENQNAAEAALAQARSLTVTGDFSEALTIVESITEKLPNRLDVLRLYGALCAQTGRSADAIAVLRRVVATVPNDIDSHILLSRAYMQRLDPGKAISTFEAALKLDQNHPGLATLYTEFQTFLREGGRGRLCALLERGFTILSDGRVTTCCVDPLGKNVFGNIYHHDCAEILRRYREVRRGFGAGDKSIPACETCNENMALYEPTAEQKVRLERLLDPAATPTHVDIEATSNCNIKCQQCVHAYGDMDTLRGERNINLEHLKRWISPLLAELKSICPYTYGEPFLYPKMVDLCRWLHDHGPDQNIVISSNGSAFGSDDKIRSIIDSGVKRLIVSFHGANKDLAARYMGRDIPFDKMVDGVRRFMHIRRSMGAEYPKVWLKSVLFEWNDSDESLNAFRALGKNLDVDHIVFCVAAGGVFGSKKYFPGSPAWEALKAAGEGE